MSYPRNAASPPRIAIGPVVQISDGAVQASGVSVKVKPEGGTASAGGGTISYEEGIVAYVPTQAETDYTAFQLIAYKTGCIPAAVTVVTSASATAGYAGTDHAKIANPTATVVLSGTTIKTATDIETDTQDLQSRIPAALVGGRIDASVGAYQSGLTPLQPTVAGRTLDVSAGGEAGIDWANIGSPTANVVFSGTTIDTITTYTGNTPQTGDAYAIANSGTHGNSAIKSALDITASQVSLVYTSIYAGQGTVAASPSPTTTSFASGRTEASGFWDDAKVTFTSGALSGQTRIVSSYSNTNGAFAFDEALTSAPSSGDTFSILRWHDHTKSQIASAVRTELATELLVVTRLGTGIELDGSVYRFTANALELAPSSSGGDATAANQTTIINHLTAIKGGGFSGSTDSLEAISDAVAGLAVSSGSGAYTITITVNDGTTALQGAIVRVTEGATTIVGTTNASGVVVFALDAAAWSLAITKPGYSYTPTTLTVSATASFTRSMTEVSIDPPAGPGLSTGTIICYGTNGLAESGAKVYVRLASGPGTAGSALDNAELTLTANGSGIASHTGFVRGATYKARRGTSGTWASFTVPDADSFDIAELEGSP